MSVVTKSGDEGNTWLGIWLPKSDICIRLIGELDELNAWIGVLAEQDFHPTIGEDLTRIQSNIMTASANFYQKQIRLTADEAIWLEKRIHEMEAELPRLKNFILPRFPAWFHVARAVCRRVERFSDEYQRLLGKNTELLVFLNRLSDYLFTAARWICYLHQRGEILWTPKQS